MPTIELRVPNIGDFKDVEIIEVLVKVGDQIAKEQPVIALESEKAPMEVPATDAGLVKELKVKQGGRVSEGDVILLLETGERAAKTAETSVPVERRVEKTPAKKAEPAPEKKTPAAERKTPPPPVGEGELQSSERPAMDDRAGLQAKQGAHSAAGGEGGLKAAPVPPSPQSPPTRGGEESKTAAAASHAVTTTSAGVHASPAVRLFARELGVDLTRVTGSGPKGRIVKEDIQRFVKAALAAPESRVPSPESRVTGLPQMPVVDFSKFGPIETVPLARIRKLSAQNLHRNWVLVPHVTQFDQADITELEDFRKEQKTEADRRGVKLTMLAFLLKACANTLLKFPELNSSLAPDGESLILKKYINLGVAVDTSNGLVVPVIREVDKKGIYQLAGESAALAEKARVGKLAPPDMQGGCFSISSLGGIGGTAFTPIVNAPEVAILGVSRSEMQPVWDARAKAFLPRLMLPLSLSYDHRVIDGAQAARITGYLAGLLSDIRRALL